MFENTFERYELKYLISTKEYKELKALLGQYMNEDFYGKSSISNVYFDTPDKLLIRRSLESPCYKEKLRVRSYGIAQNDSSVYIELKKKYKGVVYKRRIELNECVAADYLLRGIQPANTSQISREIDYFVQLYQTIEPAVFLSYQREAFIGREDSGFRMTFDQNILARDHDMDLTTGAYGHTILPRGQILLEVKTALGLPRWLLDFFSENNIYKTSFSKYGKAYTDFLLPKFLGGTKNVA